MRKSLFLQEFTSGGFLHIRKNKTISLQNFTIIFTCFYATMGMTLVISLVAVLVLMLWVYYASAIFLFGATFTFTRVRLLSNGRETGKAVVGVEL